jgi:hypothetical protein
MDELIGMALDALAQKRAQQAGQSPVEEPAAQRYQRILSDLRARAAGAPYPEAAAAAPVPQAAPRAAPASQPAATQTRAAQAAAAVPSGAYRGPLHGLFEGGNSLVRAVVAAELLDRPLALRENMRWQKP